MNRNLNRSAKSRELGLLAIAWLSARSSITAPIVSAKKIEQLNEIIKAVELKLDEVNAAQERVIPSCSLMYNAKSKARLND